MKIISNVIKKLFRTNRRILVERDLKKINLKEFNRILVVGSGKDPYRNLFSNNLEEYIRFDIEPHDGLTDIIGDIHAHADTLQTLLEKLGYHRQNRRIIQRFKPMVEQKTAYTILGNHGYDAICFHTYGEDRKAPLRAHSKKHSATSNSFCENIILTPKNRKRSLTGLKPCPYFWS